MIKNHIWIQYGIEFCILRMKCILDVKQKPNLGSASEIPARLGSGFSLNTSTFLETEILGIVV